MKRKKITNDFVDTMYLNSDTYIDYLERFKKIALSIFEWVNLPDTMDGRYLERCLYYDGKAALFNDEVYGFINTRAASAGYYNIYGLPTEINCYSYSYHKNKKLYNPDSKESEFNQAILVLNNWEITPTASSLALFAYRLADAQRTIDTNVKAHKFPVLLLSDEKQKLTLKNVYEQFDGNEPVIYGNKNVLTTDSVKSIKTDAPYVVDKLMEYKQEIFNEALTFLGINNIESAKKKERLISDEVSSNNELINHNLQSFYAPRKKAAEEFNKLYGTNVEVKVRSDLHNIVKETENLFDSNFPIDKEDNNG